MHAIETSEEDVKITHKVPPFKHKAKFVEKIEKKIQNELKLIKKNDSKLLENEQIYNDKILQVYRNSFDIFLTNISTYRSLLTHIKEAYENSLTVRDKRLKMNATLLRVMANEKESKKGSIDSLVNENIQLKQKITKLEEDNILLTNKKEMMERETLADYFTLTIEREARYTLYLENLKLKNENTKLINNEKDNTQDPVVLSLALEQSRKDLSKLTKEFNSIVEEYRYSVPRREYELLESDFLNKLKDFNQASKQLSALTVQYNAVNDEFIKLKDEYEEMKESYDELKLAGTPRPEWNVCAEYIGGGGKRWAELSNGTSSKINLKTILKELGPISQREYSEYFEGLGFDPIVPEYLQHDSQVRNLRLSRRDLSILINDIWTSKTSDTKKAVPMQDFLKHYFIERYEHENVRIEWAYNLYWGCKRMLADQQIRLFWGVLNGSMSEDIYYFHKSEWIKFKDALLKLTSDEQRNVLITDIEKALRKIFPLKLDVDIKSIMDIVKKQGKIKLSFLEVDVNKLLMEDEEGFDRTDIAKEFFRQQNVAHEKYVKEVIIQLGGKKNYNKFISVDNLKRAFAILDPHIDHVIMESYIRWTFSNKTADLNMIYPMTLRALASKLLSGNIQRVGARYKRIKNKVEKKSL